ncbi:MAG: S1 family peptidase [Arthrobacter sp.]|nr:S1 family peptidase [Arthrobacter sp.]
MKTPKYALVLRAVAAAAVVIAGSSLAVPALAEVGPAGTATASPSPSVGTGPTGAATAQASPPTPASTPAAAPSPQAGISDAGLAEATRRDLGMTLDEFNAAGELGRRAADAVPSLSGLPGYVGISLKGGKVVVDGSGTELQARIDQLNATGSPVFELHAPAAAAPSAPTSPAAPAAAELVASSTEQLFQDYLREVGATGLQAVAYADGHFVIRTGGINTPEAGVPAVVDPVLPVMPPTAAATNTLVAPVQPGKISPAEFVARYANVQLEKAAPVKTEADVYGGEGYVMDSGYGRTICSTGFGAFSPAGLPVLLTAGHCAEGGKAAVVGLEPPTSSIAGGSLPLPRDLPKLGSFGFSQFGGVNNSPVLNPNWTTGDAGEPGNVGTDIAVIEKLDGGVNAQPAVTKWDNVANPAPTSVKIIGTLAPVAGQDVCRSGRTTGWSCGTVSELGIYVAGGTSPGAADGRAFRGFLSKDVKSGGGDSGGPWISGNYAVGTHTGAESAAGKQVSAIATTLEDALTHIPDVQLQLFLNKPELAGTPSGGTVLPNVLIHGRVAAAPASAVALNSKVHMVGSNHETADIPVDTAGNWSFNAPAVEGAFQFTAETVNGYSRSGPTTFSLNVSELVAPTITSPAQGSSIAAPDRIEGTGTPGSVVTLSGDLTGSTTVAPDGQWSVPLDSRPTTYGKISVSVVQAATGHVDGPATTLEFTVPPPRPAATRTWDGLSFAQDALPAAIAGTGVDGAEVSVQIDGVQIGAARTAGGSGVGAKAVVPSLVPQVLVAGGSWSVPFPAGLAVGPHALAVSQSVDGVASSPVEYKFTITPAATPATGAGAAAESATPAAAPDAAPAALNTQGNPAVLAYTGAGGVLPTAGVAAGALLLGGVLIAFSRRRRVR